MRSSQIFKLVAVSLLIIRQGQPASAGPQTLQAWTENVQHLRSGLAEQTAQPSRFLWVDQERRKAESVRDGEIVAVHAPGGGMVPVPAGLIHHWIGSMFIPDARTSDAVAVLQDYESYADVYNPAVIESHLLHRTGDEFTYRLKFQQKGFGVKAGLLGEFRSNYYRLDARTGYSVTEATQLVELSCAGASGERPLSAEEARGYIQKMFTVVRYREGEGGLYLEVETLTMSRDVPAGLRWLVNPIIQRFSRSVMTGTLQRLRNRLEAARGFESAFERASSSGGR